MVRLLTKTLKYSNSKEALIAKGINKLPGNFKELMRYLKLRYGNRID